MKCVVLIIINLGNFKFECFIYCLRSGYLCSLDYIPPTENFLSGNLEKNENKVPKNKY